MSMDDIIPYYPPPQASHIPQEIPVPQAVSHLPVDDLGLGSLFSPIIDLLETKILGIPLWMIGGGIAAYSYFAPKGKPHRRSVEWETNPDDMDDNEEYGYDDNDDEDDD